jgi:hypothetical protein
LDTATNGALEGTDCRFTDLSPVTNLPTFIDQYRVVIPQRGRLEATVTSDELPPYVLILDSDDRVLGSDVNESSGATARASGTLAPGAYIIVVGTRTTRTGTYTLRAAFTPQ